MFELNWSSACADDKQFTIVCQLIKSQRSSDKGSVIIEVGTEIIGPLQRHRYSAYSLSICRNFYAQETKKRKVWTTRVASAVHIIGHQKELTGQTKG